MGRIIFEVGGKSVDEASVNDSTHRAVLRALIGIYKPRIEAIICGDPRPVPANTQHALDLAYTNISGAEVEPLLKVAGLTEGRALWTHRARAPSTTEVAFKFRRRLG